MISQRSMARGTHRRPISEQDPGEQDPVAAFVSRVTADGGIMEAQSCLEARVLNLTTLGFYDKSSFILTPNAYKQGTLYTLKGGSDLTFARASTRYRIGSSALEQVPINFPALDYIDGCPSLSMEPQRINFLSRSEEFSAASWSAIQATCVANATTSPDGTQSADALFENTTNINHHIRQSLTKGTFAFQYSLSVYVKPNGRDWILLSVFDNQGLNGTGKFFNVSTGALGANYNTGTGWTLNGFEIRQAPNGYYRCSIIFTSDATATVLVALQTATADGTIIYVGDIGKGHYLWGAQLEEAPWTSSYIPTTTGGGTKSDESIQVLSSVSGLIGQTEGTLFCEMSSKADGTNHDVFAISDGTATNIVLIRLNNANQIQIFVLNGGVPEVTMSTAFTSDTMYKIAFVYKQNYAALFVNGVKIAEDLALNVPGCNAITIGGLSHFRGNGKLWALSKTAISDAEAISLTTP